MKPKVLLTEPKQPRSEPNIIDRTNNISKFKILSNQSLTKSKKMSDSYYYTSTRNSNKNNF